MSDTPTRYRGDFRVLPRFGFERASALGFIAPHPKIPDDAFMVKRLPGYSPDLAGRIVYPAAFNALGY